MPTWENKDGCTQAWAAANPRSKAHAQRAGRVLPGGVTHDVRRAAPFPLAVARADGAHKWDLDGHEIICYVMGHGALLLGHSHPDVVAAVRHQATVAFHPGASHELETEWAEAVVDLVPSAEVVRFTASGTEASLLALRLARAATGRERVVKLAGHFHGWHDQVSFGTDPPFHGPDTAGVPAVLGQVVTVVPADAHALAAALRGEDVAAVILEPSGAAWGTVPLPAGLLADLRALTAATGIVLIFDEVVSGFRWSPGGVQAVAGVTPDLTTMAKIVAGGMPGGALGGAAGVMEVLAFRDGGTVKVNHPGTHNAHPVSAAAGIAMLDAVADGAAQSRADETATWLRRELDGAFARTGVAGFVYGESSTFRVVIGMERPAGGPPSWWRTVGPAPLKQGMEPEVLDALQAGMLLEGVHFFQGRGLVGTAHTEADVDRTVTAFERTLLRLRADGLA